MEKQPDTDAIAEEAVGQRHGSAPPDAVKKVEMSQEEMARRLATPSGAHASTSEKTAESVGERVGDAYSDPENVARNPLGASLERGVSRRVRSLADTGRNLTRQSPEAWFTAMVAGIALGYLAGAWIHGRR